MIKKTTRGCEHHLWINLTHPAMLIHSGTTTIASHASQSALETLQYLMWLQGKFPARHYHKHLHVNVIPIQLLLQRKHICQRLSRTRWRKNYHVLLWRGNFLPHSHLHRVKTLYPYFSQYIVHIFFTLSTFFASSTASQFLFTLKNYCPFISLNSLPIFRFRYTLYSTGRHLALSLGSSSRNFSM